MYEFTQPLETKRLYLRPVTLQDAEDLFDYAQHEEVGRPCGWPYHRSIEETRECIESYFLPSRSDLAIVDKATQTMIGTVTVLPEKQDRRNPRSCMIGYALNPKFWGQGIVPEALAAVLDEVFNSGKFDIVSGHVHTDNPKSCRVLEKMGFQREGILRMAVLIYDGTVFDEFVYSITKDEWEKQRSRFVD